MTLKSGDYVAPLARVWGFYGNKPALHQRGDVPAGTVGRVWLVYDHTHSDGCVTATVGRIAVVAFKIRGMPDLVCAISVRALRPAPAPGKRAPARHAARG